MEKKERFSTRDLVIMAVFAAIGGCFVLTTPIVAAAVPIRMPGFGGIIFVPVNTAFLLIAVGLVRKRGSATITGAIMGIVAFLLPGGPGTLILPAFFLTGVVIDAFLWAIHRNVDDSRLVAASSAFIPTLVTTWFMWWGFSIVYGRIIPLPVFMAVFMGLHGILKIIGGLAAYYVLRRVRGVIA